MNAPRIRTTVVGSYPVPEWLIALPSEQALIDATRVVIDTQEQAGVDVVCDGELYRFDVNHPETNGMIEYFVQPAVRRAPRDALRGAHRLPRPDAACSSARARPASSTARSARARSTCPTRARAPSASPPSRSSSPSPARTCWPRRWSNKHYKATAGPRAGDRRRARRAGRARGRRDHPGGRGQPAGSAGRMGMGGRGDQPRADGGEDHARGAPLLRQLRRAEHPEGHLGQADELPQRPARRPHRDGVRAPPAPRSSRCSASCGRRSAWDSASSTSSAPRSSRPTQVARAIEAAERVIGPGRVKYIHPDCGFWMLKRNMADGKIRALAAGRDLFEGRGRQKAA